jgi:hypothetical protein
MELDDVVAIFFDGVPVSLEQLDEIISTTQAQIGKIPPLPYWRNEMSGHLASAVWNYIHSHLPTKKFGTTGEPIMQATFTAQDLDLLKSYLITFVDWPGWMETEGGSLASLRQSARAITSRDDCDRWLEQAIAIGIDPL